MKKLNKKGFTIVELVIVIAVIAILAAVLIPTFSGVVDKANKSAALQEARNAYTTLMADDLVDGTLDLKEGDTHITTTYGFELDGDDYKLVDKPFNGYKVSYTHDGKWEVGDKVNQ